MPLQKLEARGTIHFRAPAAHWTVPLEDAEDKTPRVRFEPAMIRMGGVPAPDQMPVISGGSHRKTMRRLLMLHTLEALGFSIKGSAEGTSGGEAFRSLFDSEADAKRMASFLLAGGTGEKRKSRDPVDATVYEEIESDLPFVALFGGWYRGHQFPSDLKVCNAFPLTRETVENAFGVDVDPEHLPSLKDIRVYESRHARHDPRGNELENVQQSMPFAFEALMWWLTFYHEMVVITWDPKVISAFKAAVWLLQEYGDCGGARARGFGRVVRKYAFSDGSSPSAADFDAYLGYVEQNKEKIKEALKRIPKICTVHDTPSKNEKKKQDSKPAGEGEDS